jgi:glycosyltransferase involved in cell wall biosynthesis
VEPVTIAVVIPAHNSESYLASAIDSVLCQTLADWKLIVVVDGSEDATEEIAMSYAGRDRRVRVVKQTRRGANLARIRGLSEIGNETAKIAFLDADDVYEPHALDLLSKTLERNPRASAAHGLARYIDGHGMPIRESEAERVGRHRWGLRGILPTKIPASEHTTFTNLAFYNVIHTFGQVLIRMEALEKVGGLDPTWPPMVADWYLWIRLSRAGYIAFVDSVVLNYRRHENNMSNNWQLLWRESWKLRRSLIFSSQLSARERYIVATAAAYYPVLTFLRLAADSARQRRFADACTYLKHCAASYYRMARWVAPARG